MFRWLVRFSPLAAAVPLLLALPAAATELGAPCATGEGGRCEMAGPPPSMDVQPGEGGDTVTFENGHDARPEEGMISSDRPGETEIGIPSEPPRGDGEAIGDGNGNGGGNGDGIGEGDHPVMGENGDHLPVENGSDTIRDQLGDPPSGGALVAVPEPAELLLLALCAGSLLLARRRA